MQTTEADQLASRKPLRLWPGVAIVVLMWVARFGIPLVVPDFTTNGILAEMGGAVALMVWWLFFSRAPVSERLGGIAVVSGAVAATWPFLDVSISTGAMGMLFPILAIPGICLALVLWAVASRHLPPRSRWVTMAVALLLACGVWTLVRTGGFTGDFDHDFAWRWAPTAEERLLAQEPQPLSAAPSSAATPADVTAPEPEPEPTTPATGDRLIAGDVDGPGEHGERTTVDDTLEKTATPELEWHGFRGPDRDGVVRGLRINVDWATSPPTELWRRAIGPGWSSFAVHGDLLYTQEQRGDDEVVAAYRVSSGAPVWQHRDAARFWESNGGAGPRGTPTFSNGRVYAFGATGILNALDASNGRLIWSHNVATEHNVKVPDWGFASSPLVVGDVVVIAAEGKLVAYDGATGSSRWSGPEGGLGYSSPHLAVIQGVPQVLLLNGTGVTSVTPADGTRLWEITGPSGAQAAPIVQPALTADGEVLLTNGQESGMRRVAIARGSGGWTIAERWRSTGLKPYFNHFVVHKGHAYGFDGSILACIDLADGTRKWKGGRYGSGQMVLLADQDLLLVVSEEGELALVSAAADKFTELARVPAIAGKTWNHPVVVGNVVLVRNGEEMAAFRLPLAR